jgi:hypothetical protein
VIGGSSSIGDANVSSPISAARAGSISMKIGTRLGSSARPASCRSRPIALSLLSALWYGRSVVTAS